jgi:hypothetical protein
MKKKGESMVELKIVDITNKKSMECPNFGFTIDIPPRKICLQGRR